VLQALDAELATSSDPDAYRYGTDVVESVRRTAARGLNIVNMTVEVSVVDILDPIEIDTAPGPQHSREHVSFSPVTARDVFESPTGAHLTAGFEPTTVRGLPDEVLANELRAVAEGDENQQTLGGGTAREPCLYKG